MPRSRLILATVALSVLAACGSSSEQAQQQASKDPLCQFGMKNSDSLRISYIKWTGGLYNEDIDVAEFQERGVTQVVSARARPKNTRYTTEKRQDCYDQTNKFYYPCKVKIDVDLSTISGVGRALDKANARFTAVYNCERLAVKTAHDAVKTGLIESSDLECTVVEEQTCPIPKKN